MSEHLVRVGRLKQLQRERSWSDAELARQVDRKPQQLNAWWNSSRLIGERLARSLEEALKLPRYWLDERPDAVPQSGVREGSKSYSHVAAMVHENQSEALPVLEWGQLPTMLTLPNASLPKSTPVLETFVKASRAAKFVAMPDDSMAPTFQPGDHILFDPVEAPRAGDTVLVSLPTGEHLVRTFRPKSSQAWEAAPINDAYEALTSGRDDVKVVAVMVEHRRYRRQSVSA